MPSYHGAEGYFTTMSQLPRREEGILVPAGVASRAGAAVSFPTLSPIASRIPTSG